MARVLGLRSRHRCIVCSRSGLAVGGKSMWYSGFVIACIFWIMLPRWKKGVRPYTIWYRMQPRLQMSEARPTWAQHDAVLVLLKQRLTSELLVWIRRAGSTWYNSVCPVLRPGTLTGGLPSLSLVPLEMASGDM